MIKLNSSERWVIENALYSWDKAMESWEEVKNGGSDSEKEVARVVYMLRYGETRGILKLLNAKCPAYYLDFDYDFFRETGTIILEISEGNEVIEKMVV